MSQVIFNTKHKSKLYPNGHDLPSQVRYMSPFNKNSTPPQLPNGTCGNFITTDNKNNFDVSCSTTSAKLILFQPSARSSVNASGWGDDGTVLYSSHWSTTFKYESADTPQVSSCLRAGAKIQCTSSNEKREGVVRILQGSSPLDLQYTAENSINLTADCITELINMCKTAKDARVYTSEQLSKNENVAVCGIATKAGYESYGNVAFQTGGDIAAMKAGFNQCNTDMSMNWLMILLEANPSETNYNVTLMSQDRFRYKQGTLLGSLQRNPIIAQDPGRLDRTHQVVTENGSRLISEDGESHLAPPTVALSKAAPKPKAKPKVTQKKKQN